MIAIAAQRSGRRLLMLVKAPVVGTGLDDGGGGRGRHSNSNGNNKLLSHVVGSTSTLPCRSCRFESSLLASNSCCSCYCSIIRETRQQLSCINISAVSLHRTKQHQQVAPKFTTSTTTKKLTSRQEKFYSDTTPVKSLSRTQLRKTVSRGMATLISGKEVADSIRAQLKTKVEAMSGVLPKLAIVQVGGREDSNVYIRMKMQFAESIGATTQLIKLSRDITEEELALRVEKLNKDPLVHGIITQLPFDTTSQIDSDKIVNTIDPKKDVDGLSIYNAGMLLHGNLNTSSFIPCTPNGCIELIKQSGIKIAGTRSVVLGRSKIVGSPMAQLLLWADSTPTICHSRSENVEEICRQADILVAAVGRAQMVKKSWIKPGAVVIDCGINVIPDASRKSGTRLVGDVDFDECKKVAGYITPVPGGVGPMTVAMLLSNTVEAAQRAQK